MKNGSLAVQFGRYVRLLPLLLVFLFFASSSSAASLCVDGDTLANYFAAQSCYVDAGLGVQVLFTFTPDVAAFHYATDSPSDPTHTGVTTADFRVFGVTGPGVPEAGLRFESDVLAVPGDATFSDVNLTFGVSLYTVPLGFNIAFHSAHLELNGEPGPDSDAFIAAGESDYLNSVFNLNITSPPDPGNVPDATYASQLLLQPNIDLFLGRPNSQITSWVESFDLGQGDGSVPEPGTLALVPGAIILLGLIRNKRYARSILPVLALLTVLAAKSHANAVCTDLVAINGGPVGGVTNLKIDKYIAYTTNFGGCTMNDMLFKITSFTTTGTAFTVPTAGSTDLIFSIANFGTTNDVQVNYLPIAATTTSLQNLTITFQYSVTAPTSLITKMIGSTTVSGSPLPTRTTTIVPSTSPAATGSPSSGLGPQITFNNPLATTYTVTDTFNLSGLNKHISSATDKFTEIVPEPVTSFLMGGALLGLGFFSRRRRA